MAIGVPRVEGSNGPIRANRLRAPGLNPLFANLVSGRKEIANRGFEVIRANPSNVMKVMKVGVFLRIDSCESPRFAVRIAGSSKVRGDHDEGRGISSFHVSCSDDCQATADCERQRLLWQRGRHR